MHLIWLLSPVLNLVVAVLRDSVGIRYIIAVLRDRLLSGRALCLNHNKEDYYYYYYYNDRHCRGLQAAGHHLPY